MGAAGPRQPVSHGGLEFTAGTKHETNIIMLFASSLIQLFLSAREDEEDEEDEEDLIRSGSFDSREVSGLVDGSRV